MADTVYLFKANDEVISHCRCAPAETLVTWPPQMDCPWCGCGWLFTCIRCRKAFTFGKAASTPLSLEEIGRRDLEGRSSTNPTADDVEEWAGAMRILLKGVVPGETYVYLDGFFLPANSEAVTFEGWVARHDLPRMPQAEAVTDRQILDRTLSDRRYWEDRRLPE